MSNEERLQATKQWYSELESSYRLENWPCIDPDEFEKLHKILYHVTFREEQS